MINFVTPGQPPSKVHEPHIFRNLPDNELLVLGDAIIDSLLQQCIHSIRYWHTVPAGITSTSELRCFALNLGRFRDRSIGEGILDIIHH